MESFKSKNTNENKEALLKKYEAGIKKFLKDRFSKKIDERIEYDNLTDFDISDPSWDFHDHMNNLVKTGELEIDNLKINPNGVMFFIGKDLIKHRTTIHIQGEALEDLKRIIEKL